MDCLDILEFKCFSEEKDINKVYVEDYLDINSTDLANLADEYSLTGKSLGNQVLTIAKNNVLADLTLSKGNVSVNNSGEMLLNTWIFDSGYSAQNGGVKIMDTSHSQISKIKVVKIQYIPNFSGNFDIVIDDGRNTETITATATIGVINTLELTYETSMKSVIITTLDDSLEFINLKNSDAKSCQPCKEKSRKIVQRGYKDNTTAATAYKFLVEAYLICDSDSLICTALQNNNVKTAFRRVLSYQIGLIVSRKNLTSRRYNETTGVNIDTLNTTIDTLEGKYHEALYGRTKSSAGSFVQVSNGLAKIIYDHLKQSNDYCIQCEAKYYKAQVRF